MIAPLFLGLKIITSLIIAIQDMKTRLISIYLLVGLFMLNFGGELLGNRLEDIIQLTRLNILLIGVVFGLTVLYFKVIRKINNPLVSHLGWGDIFFFLALTPLFYPVVYSYVFIAMTICSTLVGIVLYLRKGKDITIPHAGISAVCYIVILIITEFYATSLNSFLI